MLLQKEPTRAQLAQLSKIDAVCSIAAITLLAAGLTLWRGSYGKPAVVYSKNWIFHTKIGLPITHSLRLRCRPIISQKKNGAAGILARVWCCGGAAFKAISNSLP
jgi:putative membrane protein